MPSLSDLSAKARSASRVVRTLHQAVATAVVALMVVVPLLGVPAATVAPVLAAAVAALTLVAKVYNVVFPAEEPLDEDPLD